MAKLITIFIALCLTGLLHGEEQWAVGQTKVQGNPVVYTFVSALPDAKIVSSMPLRTEITWKYNGAGNNGMPSDAVQRSMREFEAIFATMFGQGISHFDAYTVSGNSLKKIVLYVTERDEFVRGLNEVLADSPIYPLEINFFEDADWNGLVHIQHEFGVVEDAAPTRHVIEIR
ncbi:MAG: DUF695 domain-containing protein [Alcanivoracaceae bacterium]|nr:DUF695 domain-containing protein [Alcanivoracaceae bacterium]